MKKFLILPVLMLFAFGLHAQKKYTLRVNPEQGKTIQHTISINMDIDAGGQSVITDMTFGMDLTNTAKTDSAFAFDINYRQIQMKMNMAMMEMDYDSNNPEANEFSKQIHGSLGKLIGNPIKLNINQFGKTSDVQLPSDMDIPGMDKSMFESITTELPIDPVQVGDTWSSTNTEENSGMLAESKFTLAEVTEAGYKINLSGKIFGPDSNEIGNMSGFYILDKKTGLTTSAEINNSVDTPEAKVKTILKFQ